MSLGSSNDYSTASTTYPAVPNWKSRMEASSRKGAPSTSIFGAQTRAATWQSAILFPQLLTSSALCKAAWPPFSARFLEEAGSSHVLPPPCLSPPSSFFDRLVRFGGVRQVEGQGAWSKEPQQAHPSPAETPTTPGVLTLTSFESPSHPLRM